MDTLAEKDIIILVNELSPGYKAVFNMHVIEGYSHKEIADILGINEGTSKSQLARAKESIKKNLWGKRQTKQVMTPLIHKRFMQNFKKKLYKL